MLTLSLLELILAIMALVVLLIASYSDFKRREVPDWLNYGLIFAVFGVRSIFSFELGWTILISGILGFLAGLIIALLFYYTNQWGGGDSKLLMGMGALIGISYPFSSNSWNFFFFFLAILLLGAVYGVIFLVYVAIRKRNLFLPRFKELLKEFKIVHFVLGGMTILGLILGFFYSLFLPLAIFPLTFFYLIIFVSAVEKKCFIRKIKPEHLTEGDWLAEDIVVKGKKLMAKKTLNLEDLKNIKVWSSEKKFETVLIREGIPFVPSFLLAYLALLFGSELFAWIIKIF